MGIRIFQPGAFLLVLVVALAVELRAVSAQDAGATEKIGNEAAAKSEEQVLPGEDMLWKKTSGISKPDFRIANMEKIRLDLNVGKPTELSSRRYWYLTTVKQAADELIKELKYDDAITVLQAAIPTAVEYRKTLPMEMLWVEPMLGRAKMGKAGLTRIVTALKVLEADPTNKEAATTVIESLVADMDRADIAVRVAERAQLNELASLLKKADLFGPGKVKDFIAAGEWAVALAKRSPALKLQAQYRAYAYFGEAIKRNVEATEGQLSTQERNKLWDAFNSMPVPPGTIEADSFGLVRVDTSSSGNKEIDKFLQSLEVDLIPVRKSWSDEQKAALEKLLAQTLVQKQGLVFKGRVAGTIPDRTIMYQNQDQARRSIEVSNRYGLKITVSLQLARGTRGPRVTSDNIIAFTGVVSSAAVQKDGLILKVIDASILSIETKPRRSVAEE